MGNTSTTAQTALQQNNSDLSKKSNGSPNKVSNNRYKTTKLFKLVQQREWDQAAERSERCPDECKQWVRIPSAYNYGQGSKERDAVVTLLPLHQACYLRPTPVFVLSQLQAFPQSISVQDDYDRMPLHISCMECAGLEVIKTLLFWKPRYVTRCSCADYVKVILVSDIDIIHH